MKKVFLVVFCMLIAQIGLCQQLTLSAKQEARELERQGWVNIPGTPSIADQLRNCYKLALQCKDDKEPKYLFVHAQSEANHDFYRAYQDAIKRLIYTILMSDKVSVVALEEYFPPLGEKVLCSRMLIQNKDKEMVPYYEFFFAMHDDLDDVIFKGTMTDKDPDYLLEDFPEIQKMLAMYRLSRSGVEIYLRYAMPNSDLVVNYSNGD